MCVCEFVCVCVCVCVFVCVYASDALNRVCVYVCHVLDAIPCSAKDNFWEMGETVCIFKMNQNSVGFYLISYRAHADLALRFTTTALVAAGVCGVRMCDVCVCVVFVCAMCVCVGWMFIKGEV